MAQQRYELYLDEEQLARLATGSLVGLIVKNYIPDWRELEVVLQFPEDTLAACQDRKPPGPREIILLDHNVPSLLESIFWLQEQGATVKLELVPYKS